jgi:hypothetical protein
MFSSDSFPPSFKTVAGCRHQLGRAAQIPIGAGYAGVAKISREHGQQAIDLLAVAIPAQECLNREAMSQIMKTRSVPILWPTQSDLA